MSMFDVVKKGAAMGQSDAAPRPPRSMPGPHAYRLAVSPAPPRVAQRCSCGEGGGPCPECEAAGRVQAKLEVGPPGDAFEQEADSVADQVMRMPEPLEEEDEEKVP